MLKIYKNEVGIDKKYWNKKWWYYSIAQWENPLRWHLTIYSMPMYCSSLSYAMI